MKDAVRKIEVLSWKWGIGLRERCVCDVNFVLCE